MGSPLFILECVTVFLHVICFCFRYIRKQVLISGVTGKVAFDDNGDRINAEYDVMNVQEPGILTVVGQYLYNSVSFLC